MNNRERRRIPLRNQVTSLASSPQNHSFRFRGQEGHHTNIAIPDYALIFTLTNVYTSSCTQIHTLSLTHTSTDHNHPRTYSTNSNTNLDPHSYTNLHTYTDITHTLSLEDTHSHRTRTHTNVQVKLNVNFLIRTLLNLFLNQSKAFAPSYFKEFTYRVFSITFSTLMLVFNAIRTTTGVANETFGTIQRIHDAFLTLSPLCDILTLMKTFLKNMNCEMNLK